jgi:ferredoxin
VPAKYTIHTKPVAPRVRPVGKLGIVDWREDCASCHNCVKRACIYGLYRDEADALHNEVGYLDYIYQCKGCLNCVQNCTKNVLTRVVNPEYLRLGDEYFSPEIIVSTWFQAETGRIPVSGAGYGGPFSGPGFDSMWTDMSEIVRPTRDGIHGREYINTSVDIGRKLPRLTLVDGRQAVPPPPLVEAPLPVIFDVTAEQWRRGAVQASITAAAAAIGTFSVVRQGEIGSGFSAVLPGEGKSPHPNPLPAGEGTRRIVPLLETDGAVAAARNWTGPLVIVEDHADAMSLQASLKRNRPEQIVAIRVQATPAAAQRAVELTRGGAEVIHLVFDRHGRESAAQEPRHARDVLRHVHGMLVKQGIRDEVTLVASGGIALAEHVAKAIICGADLVAIDIPLLLAMECRLCEECDRGGMCPIALDEMEAHYGTQRIVNLMGAWHQQLIEVLGAMGIREIRRLRGETGRAMFFEDLERESFGRLFGTRKTKAGHASA